jgi:hypothetical protein
MSTPHPAPTHPSSRVEDGRHDFDFIFGDWTIHNRKLLDVTDARCTDWVEFTTTSHAAPLFGGLAHVDHITSGPDAPGGPWEGLTLRQFDPPERLWRIWWASTRNPGHLDPPLSGRFSDGVGVFLGDDTLAGEPIKLRFHWTIPAPGHPRWTQEFSHDAGATWRLNWTMDLSPRSAASG